MQKIKLTDIKISKCFERTMPKEGKVLKAKREYLETGRSEKPIVVNRNGYLIDGYARYIALKELGVESCLCNCKKNNSKKEKKFIPAYKEYPTYYVYGIHRDGGQEFIWRIPHAKEEDIIMSLLPGDKMLVKTKFGTRSIVVTKIEYLDKPPIDGNINKVIKVI